MPVRTLLGGVLLVLAAWAAPRSDDPEAACAVERLAFYYDARAERDAGPAARDRLVRRGDSLVARWDVAAPACAGRLREPLVYVLAMDRRYSEVVRRLEPYLAGPARRAEPRSRILLGGELALAYLDAGRTRDAARARYEAAGLADQAPPLIGITALNDAASIARTLGDRAAADEYLRAALALVADGGLEDLGGDFVTSTVVGRTFVSVALLRQRDVEALPPGELRDRAVREMGAMADSALGRLGTARIRELGIRSNAYGLRALALAHRGRFDAARDALDRAEAAARASGFSSPNAVHEALTMRGDVLELAGDLDGADAAHERARAEAVRKGARDNEAQSLERLGHLAEIRGDWDRAAERYEAAIDRRETFRDRIGLDDWSALAFATVQAPYRGLVRVRLMQGRTAEAFATLDWTRARYLRDLRAHLAVRRTLTPATQARVDSLATVLGEARAALADADDTPERARLRERISALQAGIETSTAAPREPTPTLDLGALQTTLLAEGRTLVSYLVDRDGSAAFVVSGDTLAAVPLDATPVDIRAALQAVGGPWRDGAADPAFALSALHDLYRMLVAPVEGLVANERVVIVPDVEVAALPFAMLTTAPAEDYAEAPYLLRRWTLSTELAAALVAEPATPAAEPRRVVAFGRSTFDEGSTWNGSDLPHVIREVDRVTDATGARAFLGDAATEARFAALAPDARVLHLASHALADPALPLYSRIALGEGDGRDGTLHLYELLEMPLDADLVVLSGCETGRGGEHDGEGIVGLQYGMRAAGADATLATLWSVADAATADLMGRVYDGLADGRPADAALRDAQLAYLEDHEGLAASPFFWAAPVLSGSPAPVPLKRRTPWIWIMLGAAAALGLGWRVRRARAEA